jgi:hypothetical protein
MSLIRLPAAALAAVLALAGAAPASADTVVEYYNKGLDYYFITGLPAEIQALDSGKVTGWTRTGLSFETFAAADPKLAGSTPVCRFLGNPARGINSHFYSASPDECAAVKAKWPDEWQVETEELFRVHAVNPTTGQCPVGTKAVFRLYNKRADANHRYTVDPQTVDSMLAKGYVLEGAGNPQRPVAFCASDAAPAQPVTGLPACTITSGTPFPIVGTPVTLTAACTGSPASFAWTNCTGTGSTCVATASAIGKQSYTLVATNALGAAAPAKIELDWQLTAAGAPSCTVAASSATPQVGSTLTLTASCSMAPSQFQWMGCSALLVDVCNVLSECPASASSCKPISRQSGTVYYAVVAKNSAGASPKSGVAVEWVGTTTGTPTPTPPPSSPTPACVITASSSAPAVNTTLTLTASCSNNPTTFTWAGCSSKTDTCTTTESSAVSRTYQVYAGNASGVGPAAQVQVTWQQPPTAPPVCTVTADNPAPYVGGSVRLTATCTQSPASYKWTNCNSSTSTCAATSTVTGPATYAVAGTNQFGTGADAATSVTWGTPPPAGADFCSRYGDVIRHTFQYGGSNDITTRSMGGWQPDGVVVAKFTTPSAPLASIAGMISLVEYQGEPAQRWMTLSTSACDFRAEDRTGASGPIAAAAGQTPSITGLKSTTGAWSGVALRPGTTYYINVMNRAYQGTTATCGAGKCDALLTLSWPR